MKNTFYQQLKTFLAVGGDNSEQYQFKEMKAKETRLRSLQSSGISGFIIVKFQTKMFHSIDN